MATFKVRPMGSVAYKLALVRAGLADITFTLTPKNEWDVAAGAALVRERRRLRQHSGENRPDCQSAKSTAFGTAGQRTFPERRSACFDGAIHRGETTALMLGTIDPEATA